MIPASVIAKLTKLNLSDEQVEAVASLLSEVEAATEDKAGAAIAARRAADRERKQRQREKEDASRDVTGSHVTSADNADEISPPKNVPHTPYKITPSLTSLRSDTSARAAIGFFEQFWAIYPRKTEKKAAATKFFALLKSGVEPESILAGARRYAASNPEPKFTKHPTTWLNRGCWDDEQLPRDGPKPERGSWLARAAMGRGFDEYDSGEHQSGQSSGHADPGSGGFARDLPEQGREDSGGPLLDLRPSHANWL